ncbi:bacteriocin-like protein [Elizabethkingia meningoseptica]|uniref:bacteriocin-like protein n=1 Tax=Elizabethkingia meningoseptica TaxID=238 RepID=UPI00301A4D28
MKNLKQLSRNALRTVNGGFANPDAEAVNPSGDYKCCWKGTDNCSKAVHHDHDNAGGNLSCVKGAELRPA